jgi:N-acetyl-anhydromuramyl-L-alanine amidase AmpD
MPSTPAPALSHPTAVRPAPPAHPGPADMDARHLPTLSLRGNPWRPRTAAREWKYIVIHHTATNSGSVDSIHTSHLKRKDKDGNPWMGIGYHFVIGNGTGMTDGVIEPTFRWREQLPGAHAGVADYNDHGIGVVLVGNFDEQPPSRAQLAAIKRLVAMLKFNYGITADRVIGHGEIRATACPGKYFPMAEISRSLPETTLSSNERSSR